MPDFLKLQFTENPKSDSRTQRDSIRPDILIQYVITGYYESFDNVFNLQEIVYKVKGKP